ncbi:primosomal protein N' [Candidatus Ornithobacterium hominis]|uniref:replication restart helicase PriA n=1 Tax=Candidatus Ornithobacterium hominis TaxID=2497989 RepID=UPI0024BCF236|nr:primosomal protein N' [Candidatus Ornithobacterium hominis]CAI9430006.1 primosomal protein N' [Candidatus Ornithobacterium hominis]
MQPKLFAEIILPLPLPGTFTYRIPSDWQDYLQIGQRVSVPFGQRKIYTGIIHSFHTNEPETYKTKPIDAILEDTPSLLPQQIELWEWMASYYMCSLGEVYKNVYPTALKLESDTYIRWIENELLEDAELSAEAQEILQALKNKNIVSVDEVSKLIHQKNVLKVLKELLDARQVRLDEKLIEKYTPKIENYIKINIDLNSEDSKEAFELLDRSPKQRELFLQLIQLKASEKNPVKAANFIKDYGGSHATLRSMEKKGLISIFEDQTRRNQLYEENIESIEKLSPEQQQAFDGILKGFKNFDTVLLHGVTSSGKTEIYFKLIEQMLQKNQTTLFLLPEIGLTTQLTQRIQKKFGELVGVYHSKMNQNQRVEIWNETLENKYKIIIGPRSALFLPLQHLGLIIVDEEHESALKQKDITPFYHARDVARVLASKNKANLLLGSATPSLEVYHAAKQGKIGYVSLNVRFGNVQPPKMEIIDLRKAFHRKEMTGQFSKALILAMKNSFEADKQVILFQNRRGYAPVIECLSCGFTPYCPNCDVALTLHNISLELKCHYCGHKQAKPQHCYQCKSVELETKGVGTEQIEKEALSIFPEQKIARMDVDSMRKKFAYEKLIEAFERKEINLLIGTQMVSKGLDFEYVNLVGIIRADNLLNFPDFRAHERAFQRIVQVAGRAGRRNQRGLVQIQAFEAHHPILKMATEMDYNAMAEQILAERQNFLYPPFVRLIEIRFRHKKEEKVQKAAHYFKQMLQGKFSSQCLLGPEAPYISRLNNEYRFHILLKIHNQQSPKKVKLLLNEAYQQLMQIKAFRSVKIDFDVDPY